MEDYSKYGKPVFETTKDSIATYAEKRNKHNQRIFTFAFYIMIFSGLDYFFDYKFQSEGYFYLLVFGGMAIFMLIISNKEKKLVSQINYDNMYAGIYENGFVIKKNESTEIGFIELGFDEIKKIKGNNIIYNKVNIRINNFNANKNDIIIYKKSGERVILDNRLLGSFVDINIFYEQLRRAFDKYQWEIKRTEYYNKQ